jgi:hypothetical protein
MKKRIQDLITSHSFDQVESMLHRGLIGQSDFEAYCAVWTWINFRASDTVMASDKQDRFWGKYGKDAFYRRVNKVRAAFGCEPLVINFPRVTR